MPKKNTASVASSVANGPTEASSHNIWLAGLGAMAKAQSQGTQAFEALIADGLALQRKTQLAAQEKINAATAQLSHLAQDFGQHTTVRIDRLEHLFEDRVARALPRLGIPSMADLSALAERVARLEAQLAQTRIQTTALQTARPPAQVAAKARKGAAKASAVAKTPAMAPKAR